MNHDSTEIVRSGGYVGREWRDIPDDYLYFVGNRVTGSLGDGARAELDARRARLRQAPVNWKITK
jgi:hypothetical protein